MVAIGAFAAPVDTGEEPSADQPRSWSALDFARGRALDVSDALAGLLGTTDRVRQIIDPSGRGLRDLLEQAAEQQRPGGTQSLVVHLISHGFVQDGALRIVGADSAGPMAPGSCDIESVVRHFEGSPQAPYTLLLLDVCHAGQAVVSQWRTWAAGSRSRVWIIGACPPENSAYVGRFSAAVAATFRRLHEKKLAIDAGLEFVPLSYLSTTIAREVVQICAAEGGYPQQVIGTPAVGTVPDTWPLLRNPRFSADAARRYAINVEEQVRVFLDEFEAAFDPEHYVGRAQAGAGPGALGDESFFTGRVTELGSLTGWLDDPAVVGSLRVITGRPGAGKSALLGVLVCAMYPALRPVTARVRNRVGADRLPRTSMPIAALHARGRILQELVVSIARQLNLATPAAGWTAADLLAAMRERFDSGTPPLIIVDALDEAVAPDDVMRLLLLELAALRRADGKPVCRLLVGTRPWQEFAPLLEAAALDGGLCDLDRSDPVQLCLDVNTYIRDLLSATVGAGYEQAADRVAHRLTDLLMDPAGALADTVGPFLVANLFVRYLAGRRTVDEVLAGDVTRIPRTLGEVLELHLQEFAADRWLRPLLVAAASAKGTGIPARLLGATAAGIRTAPDAGVVDAPDEARVREAVDKVLFYLRTVVGPDGTLHYRLFHQALADHLRRNWGEPGSQPAGGAGDSADRELDRRIMAGLLASIRPRPDLRARWDTAEPYLLRHAVDHAVDAGLVDVLLTDTDFLVYADAETLIPALPQATSDRARLTAAIYRASAEYHRDGELDTRRDMLGLDATRFGATELAERLSSPDRLAMTMLIPRWSTAAQADPSLLMTEQLDLVDQNRRIRAVTLVSVTGRELAVAVTDGGELLQFDVAGGDQVGLALAGHTDTVRALTTLVHRQRPLAVTVGDDQQMIVWDLTSGTRDGAPVLASLRALQAVTTSTWGDEVVVATAGGGPVITLWSLDRRTRLAELRGHTSDVTTLAAATLDGEAILISAGQDTTVRVWSMRTGRQIRIMQGHRNGVHAVSYIEIDAEPVIISAGDDHEILLWDARTGDLRDRLSGFRGSLYSVCPVAIADRTYLFAAGTASLIYQWDLTEPSAPPVSRSGHTSAVNTLANGFVDDRPVILSGGNDGMLRLWDASPDVSRARIVESHQNDVTAVALGRHNGERVVFSGSEDGTIRAWDINTGECTSTMIVPAAAGSGPEQNAEVYCLAAFTLEEEQLLASGGDTEDILIWRPGGETPTYRLSGHQDWVNALAVVDTPAGVRLVSGGDDAILRVWDPARRALTAELPGHLSSITSIAVTTIDAQVIAASADHDGAVMVWNVQDGTQLGPALRDGTGCVNSVLLTAVHGREAIVSAGDDLIIRVWDMQSGEVIQRIEGHTAPVQALAMLPGHPATLVSAGQDAVLRLWNLSTGQSLGRYHVTDTVYSIAVTADHLLAAGFGWEVAVLRDARQPGDDR